MLLNAALWIFELLNWNSMHEAGGSEWEDMSMSLKEFHRSHHTWKGWHFNFSGFLCENLMKQVNLEMWLEIKASILGSVWA